MLVLGSAKAGPGGHTQRPQLRLIARLNRAMTVCGVDRIINFPRFGYGKYNIGTKILKKRATPPCAILGICYCVMKVVLMND